MQKFVLLSAVASAAAFLAEDTPAVAEPAVASAAAFLAEDTPAVADETSPDADAVAVADGSQQRADCPDETCFPELEFTFVKPAAPEGAKKVQPKFKLQKKLFTCPATGDNLLGEKMPFKKGGKSPEKEQQVAFFKACQQACQQNEKCAGLEIEYDTYKTPAGTEKFKIKENKDAYNTAAGGFLKSCAMVAKADLVQYGDLLKKVKTLTVKEERDVAKRLDWVNKVDGVVKDALEKLGEAADAKEKRAPEWNFEKAEKEAKKKTPTKTLMAAVTTSIYQEWSKDSPFQCVAYVNWENIPAQSLKQFLGFSAVKGLEIAAEVDAAKQGSAEAAKALSKLKFVKDQVAEKQLALDALKMDSAKLNQDLEELKTKTEEAKAVIVAQDEIKSMFKTRNGRRWKAADKMSLVELKKIELNKVKIQKVEAELAFQTTLGEFQNNINDKIATAAAKAQAVEEVETPVKEVETPVKKVETPSPPTGPKVETPVKSSAETKKTGCNKKLHILWVLVLIPVGVAAFFIVKSKKSEQTRSIDDDDL